MTGWGTGTDAASGGDRQELRATLTVALVLFLCPAGAFAADGYTGYSKHGADTCLKCHDEDYEYPVMAIFETPHGSQEDPRAPFAGLQCEACHGPGRAHTAKVMPGEERPAVIVFGESSSAAPERQNAACLQCHRTRGRIQWNGSVHESSRLVCASCHRIHSREDPVLDLATQPQVCFRCHQRQRADVHKMSVHPIRFGKMVCSDCHDVHGGPGPVLLRRPTLNETCYQCHPEKRGPFLWEHAPVPEDCTHCHLPHGSNHPALLKKRPPLLCQQCHSQAGHPSIAYSGTGLAGPLQAAVLAKGCLNCHSQVHGSNHPSGVKRQR
ncbi:DmsE family decaheme c-type cytochrome [Methylohalobius crimeensis]|uniref:DmsE family decaheme c-type cytochrome n=1 Tax=Methylohalobius crimeensis TaxID=244365 RepID=UPI00040AF88C|nr:DmsE family decaheme c-type cytochrome [Methylohalobius crimeensis]